MTVELLNYQWELGGVVFGYDCAVDHESDVAPPEYSPRTEDQQNPFSDGMTPGIDLFEPGSWQFKLFTNAEDEGTALESLAELRQVWRGDAYRKLPGEATELRYRLSNRTRVVYGRPRRFSAPLGVEYLSGRIPITADFQTVSELFFDAAEQSIPVGLQQPTTGGFTAPFTTPLTTDSSPVNMPYTLEVGGELPTPTLVDFIGPLDSTGLLIDGEPYIRFQEDIPAGVTVTVDARPWVTAVYRQDGAPIAGWLSPRSRMPAMQLEPGFHTATLLGSSPTGLGRAQVRWRGAHPSL